METMIPRIKIE